MTTAAPAGFPAAGAAASMLAPIRPLGAGVGGKRGKRNTGEVTEEEDAMPAHRVRSRGFNGCWKTYDRDAGAIRDVNGWDATAKAAIDGGGLTEWGDPTRRPRSRRGSKRAAR